MFESAELGHTIDDETFEAAVPALREALLEAELGPRPELVVVDGLEG